MSEEESQKTKGTLSNLGSILGVDDEEERRAEEERIERELAAAKKEQEAARLAMQADEKAAEVKRTSGDGEDEAYDYSERAIAGLCYMLPLLDSLKYSKFLLIQFPVFSLALLPLKPLIDFWFRLGFLQILAFFGMYLGVVQNPQMKRFVRFNAQQAVLLDILLIVPDVLTRLFSGIDGQPPMDGPGLQAEILLFNTVFLYTYFSSVVGVGASGLGKTFKLPLVGDAADSQQPR